MSPNRVLGSPPPEGCFQAPSPAPSLPGMNVGAGSGPAEVEPFDENFHKGAPVSRGGFLATEKLCELKIIARVSSDSFQAALSFLKKTKPHCLYLKAVRVLPGPTQSNDRMNFREGLQIHPRRDC